MEFNWEVSRVHCLFRALGLWPEDNRFVDAKFIASFVFTLISYVPTMARVFFAKDDKETMENLSYTLTFLIAVIEVCIMKWNRLVTKTILIWMNENWKYSRYFPIEFQVIMHQQGVRARRIMTIIYIVMAATVIAFFMRPIVMAFWKGIYPLRMPNNGWYPFSVETSPNFEIIFIIDYCAITCSAIVLVSVDCYMVLITYHLCGQISILCNRIKTYKGCLEHLTIINREEFQHYCNCLKCIVNRHTSILQMSVTVEDSVHFIIFVRFLLHVGQICTVGFIMLQAEKNTVTEILLNSLYLSTIILSCFVYCWIGEQLTQHGYAISQAVYENKWYESSSIQVRRSMIMIICRAQRPISIKAGKYVTMSLCLFAQFVKTSVSYLSVLMTVKSGKK